jgi:5-hydroxyisourate hydrolase
MLPPRGSNEARLQQKEVGAGLYKIVFKPKEYFEKTGRKCFYPWVEVTLVYY